MSRLRCRNCGDEVVEFEAAKIAVQAEYNYSDEELISTKSIRVWHCDCAKLDHRIDTHEECGGDFYWEVF